MQNSEKFVVASGTVEFANFVITPANILPSDQRIRAFRYFPTPQNISGIQVCLSHQSSLVLPITPTRHHFASMLSRPQLPNSIIGYNPSLQSKDAALDESTEWVRLFDSKCVTCLAKDWSKKSIGFWILHHSYLLLSGSENSVRR